MKLERYVFIKCDSCKTAMEVDSDYFDCETNSYERNMGAEIEYNFRADIVCENCGSPIEITITGWEYPIGAYNYDSYEIFGGQFIIEPNVSIIYEHYFNEEIFEIEEPNIIEIITFLKSNPEYIYDVDPREFEEMVAELFASRGYDVELTKETRDGGRDIIVKSEVMGKPLILFVECKCYKKENKVNVKVVRELFGVGTSERVNAAMIVTTSAFTKDAIEFAEKQNTFISLSDFKDLRKWIEEY